MAVTATSHGLALLIFGVLVVLVPAPSSAPALWSGAAAGVFGGIGVSALFAALARGRMSVVAPVTAALSGSLPALYDLARGQHLGTAPIAGLVLALVATITVSATAHPEDDGTHALPPAALALAVLSGVAFAGAFISFSFAPHDSGFWPLLAARITSFAMLGTVTLARRRTLALDAGARSKALASGVLEASANVTMLWSIRLGPLAVASVLGSLYPVMTLLLARVVLKEKLHGLQRAGVGLALVAVILTALR
ncbi:MAG TPA: EamA family transporter [Coriobacteriia bacterium]|nr:EamA family transporter [Coriobacteriia bacterium]